MKEGSEGRDIECLPRVARRPDRKLRPFLRRPLNVFFGPALGISTAYVLFLLNFIWTTTEPVEHFFSFVAPFCPSLQTEAGSCARETELSFLTSPFYFYFTLPLLLLLPFANTTITNDVKDTNDDPGTNPQPTSTVP